MIGLIATVASGLILKNYFMLLSLPVFLMSRKNRDLGLIAYFLYALFVAKQTTGISVYYYEDLVNSLIFASALLLFLNDVLSRDVKVGRIEVIATMLILSGLIIPEMFLAGTVFYFITSFELSIHILLLLSSLVIIFALFEEQLNTIGGTSNQIVILSSFAIFTSILTSVRGNLKKVDFLAQNR
ncbi:hypothetical protein [Thermococcus barophilus]|uniref:Uncharacterized protein n=1 Tax=Thermococcus barophilus TaxID=55802 RepID=A0A0S1XF25_THEBA|nr:hypothetical protein [Thermococcus barophilus]ALM76399.1 conserved membrane hypothetical protein [Thermococcus barophilus]